MNEFVNLLIEEMISIHLPQTFNPYADICDIHDKIDSAKIRRENLMAYLKMMVNLRPTTIWIGEALGYRGGRRTGLPFTDEYHLKQWKKFNCSVKKSTATIHLRERTASSIWKVINQINKIPMFWNIFPFHCYSHEQLSNRKPKISEIQKTETILKRILDFFSFEIIYSIGRASENYLNNLGIKNYYVRHPSYGGSKKFQSILINKD